LKRFLPFILTAAVAVALSVGAQAILQQALTVTLPQGYVGDKQTYGAYIRNQAAGIGTDLWSGYGNYGVAAVAAPTGGSTGVGAGVLMVGAGLDRSFGGIARSTSFKAGASNIGFASWAYNEDALGNPSGTVTGIYAALDNLPNNKAQLDAQLEPAAALFDNRDAAAPALVARNNGAKVLEVPLNGQLRLHNPGLTQPACTAAYTGAFWFQPGITGVADKLEVCGKDQTDAFVWKPAAIF